MRRALHVICFSLLPLIGLAVEVPAPSPSLLQLLADPSRYHDRKVQVLGYCRLEFEGLAIFLHKEDYTYGLGNMVWLELDLKDITFARRKITYCLVEGTYNAKNRGHLGMFSGAIEQITRYDAWPPTPPRRGK